MADDMFPNAPIPLRAQIECVEREIKMREKVYPRQMDKGHMTEERAVRELRTMEAVRDTLRKLEEGTCCCTTSK